MKALFKTLFGSPQTLAAATAALALAVLTLHSPAPQLTGLIFPTALIAGVAHLAKH